MKLLSIKNVLLVTLLFSPIAAHADDRDNKNARASLKRPEVNDAESTVARASDVYKQFTKEGKIPGSVLKNTKCVGVFPSVITAAAGVGGTHGDGVAFCRNSSDSKWGGPLFLNMTGASVGLQAGAKSTDIVLYMTGNNARSALEKGDFSLVGDFSAIAGSFDETYIAPPSGVVAYTSTGGVFAGAALVGLNISHDQDEQKAFYGTYDRNSFFEGPIPPRVQESVTELRKMLPS